MTRNNHFGITNLDPGMLSTLVPKRTFGGGTTVENPEQTLFLWRSTATERAREATLGFFLDDSRLAPLWARPERYAVEFKRFGVASVVEPDFSIWADTSEAEQLDSVRKKKIVSRIWQQHGLLIVPNLNWSDARSYPFAFAGVPVGAPAAMTECRTCSASAEDRRAFSRGLHEAVRQVQPATLVIYGGKPNRWWIERDLPASDTQFVFLESWTDSRARVRKAEKRRVNATNQLTFGGDTWAEEEATAA